MKKLCILLLVVIFVLSMSLIGIGCKEEVAPTEEAAEEAVEEAAPAAEEAEEEEPEEEVAEETYVMCTFISGIEFWIPCFNGMKAAAKQLGVKAIYQGAEEYDATQQARVLEQIIASNPDGIVTTVMNPDALTQIIDKAIDAGMPLVVFDSDAPDSKRPVFIGGDNYQFGVRAGKMMAQLCNEEGKVVDCTYPGQLNLMQRAGGFEDTIKTYPNMELLPALGLGNTYEENAANVSAALIAHPDLKGIFVVGSQGPGAAMAVAEAGKTGEVNIICMDIDDRVKELIKSGEVTATLVQGGWNMGYWSMIMVYDLKHNLLQPIEKWKEAGISPLPNYLDTGCYIVTKDNVDLFDSINIPTPE